MTPAIGFGSWFTLQLSDAGDYCSDLNIICYPAFSVVQNIWQTHSVNSELIAQYIKSTAIILTIEKSHMNLSPKNELKGKHVFFGSKMHTTVNHSGYNKKYIKYITCQKEKYHKKHQHIHWKWWQKNECVKCIFNTLNGLCNHKQSKVSNRKRKSANVNSCHSA